MLIRELPAEGAWLFRHRSILPVCFLPVLAHAALTLTPEEALLAFSLPWNLFCLAVSLSGLLVRVLTVGFVPVNTSGRNTREQRADQLNTTGLYSIVRHPLYVGNCLIWLGICLTLAQLEVVLLFLCAFWLYYERIMAAEEAFLSDKFGELYRDWASRTPAFIPRFRQWRKPSLPFCWRTTVTREYCGILGIGVAFALCNIVQNYLADGRPRLETVWAIVLGVCVILFVVPRTLKKRRLIRVPGRC